MTDMQLGFVGGFLLGVGGFAVFHLMVVAEWRSRVRSLKATVFGLEEHIKDIDEGRDERVWQMRSDGVEVVVERGRPDIPKNRSLTPPASAGEVLDLKYVFGEDEFNE